MKNITFIESWWNDNDKETLSVRRKDCISATVFTTKCSEI